MEQDIQPDDVLGKFEFTWVKEGKDYATVELARVDANGDCFVNWNEVERVAEKEKNAFCMTLVAVRDGKSKPLGAI
jgi:hypothetical protein